MDRYRQQLGPDEFGMPQPSEGFNVAYRHEDSTSNKPGKKRGHIADEPEPSDSEDGGSEDDAPDTSAKPFDTLKNGMSLTDFLAESMELMRIHAADGEAIKTILAKQLDKFRYDQDVADGVEPPAAAAEAAAPQPAAPQPAAPQPAAPQPAADPQVEYKNKLLNSFLRDIIIGRGFQTLLDPPQVPVEGDEDQAKPDLMLSPPRIDFVNDGDKAWVDAIMARMQSPDTADRFRQYLDLIVLGIATISGFAGSGKTEMLALTAHLYRAHPDIKFLYCSAPSHVAVGNMAARIAKVGVSLAKDIGGDTRIPLVIHGHLMNTEMSSFISMAGDASLTAPNPNMWQQATFNVHLSPCEWLLKVVQAGKHDLDPLDKPELFALRERFQEDPKMDGLRRFLKGEIKWNEISKIPEVPEPVASPDTSTAPKQEKGKPKTINASALLRGLLQEVIGMADFLCTTPFPCCDKAYKKLHSDADAVILDEAGAMHQADAYMVWGTTARPCAMGGDEKQICPPVMDQKNNRFAADTRVSILEHMKMTGHPFFQLNRQMRIVEGGFDLAREIIYPHVKDFTYADSAKLENQPLARKIESWMGEQYSLTSPLARYNDAQNAVAINTIAKMVSSRLVDADQVAIITPYRANLERLEKALKAHDNESIRSIAVNTTDSPLGQENSVVFLVCTVDEMTGPLFVANIQRICVSITRHVAALFVVGDIKTVSQDEPDRELNKGNEVRGDNGEYMTVKNRTFVKFLKYFIDNNRVAKVDNLDAKPKEEASTSGDAWTTGGDAWTSPEFGDANTNNGAADDSELWGGGGENSQW
ncbi:hypothetical protein PG991_001240 [Apiospora marii]|uniref:DNA2/NAM7 helicase-like C-terminal domain-containing protein n=1 Tax=Apiospora marii TaxID=335849 RepID=A0ABR1SRI2_9PEZI